MAQEEVIRLFDAKQIRVVWDSDTEKYYFSVVDVVQVLTDSADYQTARKYWNKLKQRLSEEGNQTVTNCHGLKLTAADGKQLQRVADQKRKQMLAAAKDLNFDLAATLRDELLEMENRIQLLLE